MTLRRFLRAAEGATAVEFACCVPILLIMLFGMIEVGQLIVVQHRSENAAATIGDVVARNDKLTDAQEGDIFAAAGVILGAAATGKPDLRLGQIVVDSKGAPHWDWSDQQGSWFAKPAHCAAVSAGEVRGLSPAALSPGARLLVSDIHYAWSSPLDLVLQKPIDLSSTLLSSPRRGQVTRVTTPAPQPCPA